MNRRSKRGRKLEDEPGMSMLTNDVIPTELQNPPYTDHQQEALTDVEEAAVRHSLDGKTWISDRR